MPSVAPRAAVTLLHHSIKHNLTQDEESNKSLKTRSIESLVESWDTELVPSVEEEVASGGNKRKRSPSAYSDIPIGVQRDVLEASLIKARDTLKEANLTISRVNHELTQTRTALSRKQEALCRSDRIRNSKNQKRT
mmetsp:Transcript_9754/g.16230  ORF Transcript_9754/g.16230 Transcript_9754/m.16230 type:complete len:136 (+) Transcript_9754:531-938(+)